MRMEFLKKRIDFYAAYDKTHPDPKKNYGVHGVDMRWYLTGDSGAVQFVVYTNWHLPHVMERLNKNPWRLEPMGADVGYHSKVPLYEDQKSHGHCNILDCDCYYDGSGLQGIEMMEKLIEHGGDYVWAYLRKYYEETFGVLTELQE